MIYILDTNKSEYINAFHFIIISLFFKGFWLNIRKDIEIQQKRQEAF